MPKRTTKKIQAPTGGDDITRKRVGDLEKRLEALEARVAVVNVPVLDAVDLLRRDTLGLLQSFERRMADRFDQVDARLGRVDARLGQIDGRLGGLESSLETKIESAIGESEERITRLLEAMEERLIKARA